MGSVRKKEIGLKLMVKRTRADFINLCETWCKSKYDISKLNINGYKIIRLDRDTKTSGGGLMTFYKEGYDVDELKYAHLNCNCKTCEFHIYTINIKQTRPLIVINCYKPPHINTDLFLTKLKNILENLEIKAELYIGGDTNIDYSIKTGNRYHKVKSFENQFQLRYISKIWDQIN